MGGAPLSLLSRVHRSQRAGSGAAIATFAIAIFNNWLLIAESWIPVDWYGASEALVLSPFIAGAVLSRIPSVILERRAGIDDTPGDALRREARPMLVLFLPFLVLSAIDDLIAGKIKQGPNRT